MTESVKDLVAVARAAAREIGDTGIVGYSLEDIEQDAVLWLLEHPAVTANAQFDDGRYNVAQLVSRLKHELGHILERQRQAAGPRPYVSLYDRDVVEAALPVVWDPEHHPDREEDAGDTTRGMRDPQAHVRWIVVAADVQRAYARVVAKGSALDSAMFRHYCWGDAWDTVADAVGIPRSTLQRRAGDVVTSILVELNGSSPQWEERRVMRKAQSNASALAHTRADYGGEQ
jgi:hypothetical protein